MLHRAVPTLALLLAAGCAADAPTVAESHDPHAALSRTAKSEEKLSSDVLAALAQVRRATARYHNIDAAMADGYTVWSPNPATSADCMSSATGRMGYHLVNPSLRGSPLNPGGANAELDPLRPEMLLYEKLPNGKLRLVGVEYLVFQAAWQNANGGAGAAPPTLFGQTVPLSNHAFPLPGGGMTGNVPHYELHVWIWSNNPNGIFDHYNPTVSC
jgi:hypothetical protein